MAKGYTNEELQKLVAYADSKIAENPNDYDAYALRALTYTRLGNTKEAEADLAKIKQLRPDSEDIKDLDAILILTKAKAIIRETRQS